MPNEHAGKETIRESLPSTGVGDADLVFNQFFQRSVDAIWLLDPATGVFVDCNQAAVDLLGAASREQLLQTTPGELSPKIQADGRPTQARVLELIERVQQEGSVGFEWLARRLDGQEVLLEVLSTAVVVNGRSWHVVISKRANQHLQREIAERERAKALLKESEAQARILVEHAPDAIVVFDVDSGRFVDANPNAERLYGLSREALLLVGPGDVSPALQPDGRASHEVAGEKLQEALDGGTPVFDWWHRNAAGQIIPCEIRLVRLPAQGRRLIRGSVIDNSERERRQRIQRALYQISEAIHKTEDLDSLYRRIHATIQGLMPAVNFYIALYEPMSELFSFPYFVDEMDPPPAPRRLTSGLTSYVLKTGKPLLVNDRSPIRKEGGGKAVLIDDGGEVPYIEVGTPAAVWLGAPLNVRGQTIGVLAVQDYRDEHAYGPEENRILAFVAEQVAIAIERKRAEQALRYRSEQIARHRDALLELAQLDKSDFGRTLERICQLSALSLGVARVGYWFLAEDERALTCELLYLQEDGRLDPNMAGVRLAQDNCPAYFQALSVKRPIVASRADAHPATAELRETYLKPLGITSMLDVPVWLHGRVMGVLCHEHVGTARDWTAEEIDFVGSLATMVSLAYEAAQRARSEEALRASEAKFRALFEASSQGVMLHDEEKFLEVNPATVRILGYNSAEELIGRHPAETSVPIQPNGQSAEVLSRQYIQECMQQGSVRFEWLGRNPHGGEVPIEVILTRIEMEGRPVIQAVINDITERKKAEAELLRTLAREKELGQLKSNFVSMVSHEFRTPLGIIMSSAEIVQDYLEQLDPAERQNHLQSITKNTRRMADLMEEVLLLGRFEAGKMDFRPTAVDLASFARRLVEEMLSATDRRCPIELTAAVLPVPALADERLLRHVFTNLLTNAVKYSEPNQPVRWTIRCEGHEAVCSVQDQGIGIPEADVEWLFNAFHRGRNVGERNGTGLGLVIVKRCIELHGGRIKVESRVGSGTTLTVRLPVFG